jgi:hypothetical protein
MERIISLGFQTFYYPELEERLAGDFQQNQTKEDGEKDGEEFF